VLKSRAAAHNAARARFILSTAQIETQSDEIATPRRHPSLPSRVCLERDGLFEGEEVTTMRESG
jgi:hypothetical protein